MVEGEAKTQIERKARDPLASGYVRDHLIDEMGGAGGHPSTAARWAETAALAAERDETVLAASVASKSSEAVGEHAALEKTAELRLDEAGHTSAIGVVLLGPGEGGLEVGADRLMEDRLLAVAARVGRGHAQTATRLSCP